MSVLAILALSWLPARAPAQTTVGEDSAASASEFDLPSYRLELAHIEQAAKNPQEIRELRNSLPLAWTVRNGDRVYSVPTVEIADALRQIEHNPKAPAAGQLEARLRAMQRHAEALLQPRTAANDAGAKLKKILARGEFQDATGPSALDLWRARAARWIVVHILRLLGFLHISQKTGNALAWVVLFAAIVALFYAIYRWLTKSSKQVDFRAEVEPSPSDARHWVQEALAAAERGDFREAVHCAYWAAVAHLEDIRMLPRDRARTPRESLRLLEQFPRELGVLKAITRSFELVWYGYRPVSATEWAGTKEQLEKMGCLQPSIAPTVPS
jgi:Domain of unknown function (DUF4129)